MEMTKIEQVIVGDHMKPPSSAERIEPVDVPIKLHHDESPQCLECFITFNSPKTYERHIKKHHQDQYTQQLKESNTLFTCFKCAKYFHGPDELIRHQVTHKREKTPFPCTRCKEKFCTYTELRQHDRFKCRKRQFPRKDCDGMFASDQNCGLESQGEKGVPKAKWAAKEEKAMESRKKSSVELKIPCPKPDCDCTFPSVEALRAHKQAKHGPPLSQISQLKILLPHLWRGLCNSTCPNVAPGYPY